MDQSRLLSLSSDLQEMIARYVCKNSVTDLFNLKLTCKSLRDVSERSSVYAAVDVLTTPLQRWQHSQAFMRRCFDNENPSALYLKGSHSFFMHGRFEEGLRIIKTAADKGYVIAIYAYAMLSKAFFDDGTILSSFSRTSIRAISSYIRDNGWGWEVLLPSYNEKKIEFMKSVLPSLYNCKCNIHRGWCRWYDDGAESLDMCDDCFWNREMAMFYEFFGVHHGPDTRDW